MSKNNTNSITSNNKTEAAAEYLSVVFVAKPISRHIVDWIPFTRSSVPSKFTRDCTSEANVFLRDGAGDIGHFLRLAPRLFNLTVEYRSCVWLLVSADGTFDRHFVGYPWYHIVHEAVNDAYDELSVDVDAVGPLPVGDVVRIVRDHDPECERRMIASIEQTNARDQFLLDRAQADAEARKERCRAREANIARKDEATYKAIVRRRKESDAEKELRKSTWWRRAVFEWSEFWETRSTSFDKMLRRRDMEKWEDNFLQSRGWVI